jgi:hypothetical protein
MSGNLRKITWNWTALLLTLYRMEKYSTRVWWKLIHAIGTLYLIAIPAAYIFKGG